MEANKENKVVLITGASSGIGQAMAKHFSDKGWVVYGTSRQPPEKKIHAGVSMLSLDVRSEESAVKCIAQIIKEQGHIDVLINNAGMALQGSIEGTEQADIQQQFETNLFGATRMIRMVLPFMREARSGHIVNFSSLVGYAAIPFMGIYSASKFAVEGMSEALYHEVLPHGIKVSIIEPGVVKTGFFNNGVRSLDGIDDYAQGIGQVAASMRERIARGVSAEKVAESVYKTVTSKRAPLRCVVGPDSRLVAKLKRFVPDTVFSVIWRREFGLS